MPPSYQTFYTELVLKSKTKKRSELLVGVCSIRDIFQMLEQIDLLGPTGCGKSTLALSFFRFVEAYAGKIILDGVDISKIGLRDLRSRITIIPQDPTILSGTLRTTLDVFDEHSDEEIYESLKRVHLLKEGGVRVGDGEGNKMVFNDLTTEVSEQGQNFSQGD
jgi:ABC-type multidrug transport system fused ATPase/permease subunit